MVNHFWMLIRRLNEVKRPLKIKELCLTACDIRADRPVMLHFLWFFSVCYNMCDSGWGFWPLTRLSPTKPTSLKAAEAADRDIDKTLPCSGWKMSPRLPLVFHPPPQTRWSAAPPAADQSTTSQMSLQPLPGNHRHKPISWGQQPKPTAGGGVYQ